MIFMLTFLLCCWWFVCYAKSWVEALYWMACAAGMLWWLTP